MLPRGVWPSRAARVIGDPLGRAVRRGSRAAVRDRGSGGILRRIAPVRVDSLICRLPVASPSWPSSPAWFSRRVRRTSAPERPDRRPSPTAIHCRVVVRPLIGSRPSRRSRICIPNRLLIVWPIVVDAAVLSFASPFIPTKATRSSPSTGPSTAPPMWRSSSIDRPIDITADRVGCISCAAFRTSPSRPCGNALLAIEAEDRVGVVREYPAANAYGHDDAPAGSFGSRPGRRGSCYLLTVTV